MNLYTVEVSWGKNKNNSKKIKIRLQVNPISCTEDPSILTENINLVTSVQLLLLFGRPNALSIAHVPYRPYQSFP